MADTKTETKRRTREEIIAQKTEMASRPDTKVVFTRTPESHTLFLVMKQADVGISTLKSRIFTPGYDAEEVLPLIQEYHQKCKELQDSVEKIFKKIGFGYKRADELK